MSFAHGLPAVRVFRPGRRVALVCLVVAAASAVTSFALGSPLSRSWPTSSDVDWLPFVGGMLPLLAMCASAAGLFGSKAERSIAAMPEVETLIRLLNDTLSGEREQVTRLQRSCEVATQDAAAASARVARAADAAIDAETRLASGIAQWERKWEEHLAAATPYGGTSGPSEESLAARVVQRIEGVMPDFADIIRTKFAAFPDPSFHIAAGRLNATVEAAMVTFKGVIDDASHKMNSLNDISQSLRRDAVALDLAGREIATAGATVVARAGEAISGVDAALASLPAAVVSMNGVASEMKGSLEEATLAMRANRTALMTAGDQAAQSAGRLLAAGSAIEEQREAVDTASERITSAVAEVIARVDAAQADRATLTDLIGRLHDVADVLTRGTGTLTQAGQQATGGVDATLAAIRSATGEMIEQIRGALAPLPAATADLATQVRADIAARLGSQIDAALGSLIEASRITPDVVAHVSADIAERLTDRIDAAVGAMTNAAQLPPDLALTLATAVAERVAPRLNIAMDVLASAEATLDAAGRRTNEVCEAALQSLAAATEGLSAQTGGGTSLASVLADAELEIRMAEVLAPLTAAAQFSAQALTGAADALTARTAETMAQVPAALAAAGDALVARAEETLGEIPAATARLTSAAEAAVQAVTEAAGMLCGDSAALEATGRETVESVTRLLHDAAALRETGDVITDTDRATINGMIQEVDAVIGRLITITATTDDAARELAGLKPIAFTLETIATTLTERAEHLDAAGQRITAAGESVIERLADNASLGEVAMQPLPVIAEEVDIVTAALRSVAETLSANAVTAPLDMDRLERLNQRFEIIAAGLPGSIEARVAAAIPGNLPDAAMRLAAIAPKLDQLDAIGSRLETLAERLPTDIASQVRDAIPASLSDTANRLEVTTPLLEQVSGRLETVANGLQQTLPETAAQFDAMTPKLDQLDAIGSRLEMLAERLPSELAAQVRDIIPASLSDTANRLDATAPKLEQVSARLETAVDGLQQTLPQTATRLEALGPKLEQLDATSDRLEALAVRLPAELGEILGQAIPAGLPEAADRLDATAPVLETLAQRLEYLADRLPGDIAGSLNMAIPAGLPEAAARLEAATPALDAVAQRLEALADRLPAELASQLHDAINPALPDMASRLEAAAPRLEHLDRLSQRLEAVATQLPDDVTARIPTTLADTADKLDAVGVRLETALSRLPSQDTENMSTIATLAALTGDIGESVKRVEAALVDHDGALISLMGSMSRVQAAAEDMQAMRSEPVVPAADGETSLGAALTHLDGVADQAEQLLRQSEALAEAVMAGRAPALSSLLADRAPVLLARVETATRRLRSAATALAIASDGPTEGQKLIGVRAR